MSVRGKEHTEAGVELTREIASGWCGAWGGCRLAGTAGSCALRPGGGAPTRPEAHAHTWSAR